MSAVSVAFIDNCPIMMDGLVASFAKDDRFRVVAQGTCATDLLSIAERNNPDIAIVDMLIPGDLFKVLKQLRAVSKTTKVIVFTAVMSIEYAIRALDAGARGYILKSSTAEDLMNAAAAVQCGEIHITNGFAGKLISALRNRSAKHVDEPSEQLSAREAQIVHHLTRGLTNKEIAAALLISEKTVKHYMTVLMQKFNARNRLEVLLMAQKLDRGENGASAGRSLYMVQG